MKFNYNQLLDIIKKQSEVIKKQTGFIDRLLIDNAEKENFINSLLSEWQSEGALKVGGLVE